MGIGTSANAQQGTQGWLFSRSTCRFRSLKIYPRKNTLKRGEWSQWNFRSSTWLLPTFPTRGRNWIVSNTGFRTTINVFRTTATHWKPRKQSSFAAIWMSAIKRLTLLGPRAIKKLLASPLKRETVSQNSWPLAGPTLSGNSTPTKWNTPGGVCVLGEGPRTSGGDWTTSWWIASQWNWWRTQR